MSIREESYKLAKYYDADHPAATPVQAEMYDLADDPQETRNLAHDSYCRTAPEEVEFTRLRAQLELVERTRLQPLPRRAGQSA